MEVFPYPSTVTCASVGMVTLIFSALVPDPVGALLFAASLISLTLALWLDPTYFDED